jgi:hypothetical protein
MARIIAAVVLVAVVQLTAAPAQPSPPSSFRTALFRFQPDEFWLNLHHFLYVLGRSVAKMSDASRDAVVHAPAESTRGLAALDEADKKAWMTAMAFYAAGPSRNDAISDDSLAAITRALANAGDAVTLKNASLDDGLRSILENAAPAYRKAWWPAHHAANSARRDEIQALVQRHGAAVLAFITRAYELPWPPDGYPVHFSGYANWAGGYSTTGNLLVVSSLDRSTQGLDGFETVFHEGMHQWDGAVSDLLYAEARRTGTRIPSGVSHAMIFFTAGEAVRRVAPDHTPVADAYGVWGRGMARLKAVLQETWKPYLDGRGTRDEAIAALVARLRD